MAVRNIDVRPSLVQLLVAAVLLCWATFASAQDWTYRARPGDTLWDLGARYLKANVPWQQLQAHNRISDPYRLAPGLTLRFPIAWLRVQPAPARVVALRGPVQVSDPVNGTRPLQADMLLPIGSQLQTGDDASVTLSFADDSRLQLRENSLLQLDQLSSHRHGRHPHAAAARAQQQPGDTCARPGIALHHHCTHRDQQRARHLVPGECR